jgi:ubiquinone/menaquinone biosynthesis C-methylase UbiE
MAASDFPYLHGFSSDEQDRLRRQARFAEQQVFSSIDFSRVDKLIEVGCGVGAQTEILLRRFPQLSITGLDRSEAQLSSANAFLDSSPVAKGRFELHNMDATDLEFDSSSFDAAFLCWVLEHVPEPAKVLSETRRVLRPGSKVVVTEVLNSSFFLEPYSPNTWKYWMGYNDFQISSGGDPFIGAKLGNLLLQQGYKDVRTEIKTWHLDNRCPGQRKEIIEFWSELLFSAADQLVEQKIVDEEVVANMAVELKRVKSDPNAVFFYSFIQAQAIVT